MDLSYPGFGSIVVEGKTYDHDVVIEAGVVRARSKKPSKQYRSRFGHTPLSVDEDIPWSSPRIVIGTGAGGQLPIMDEVREEAADRGVELVTMPTARACETLREVDSERVFAILHVTC